MTDVNTAPAVTPAPVAGPQDPAATAPTGPTISIVDLQNVVAILDASFDRGSTWKGLAEIMQVKTVRDKIAEFVASVTPPAPEAPVAEETVKVKKKAKKA
jgi:hypothetical protein